MDNALLLAALCGALAFWRLQPGPHFAARPLIKAVMAAALAFYVWQHAPQASHWAAAGLGLSAIGDALLDLPDDKGFLAGLVAFLLGHLAYLIWLGGMADWYPLPCLIIGAATLGYFFWLRPAIVKTDRMLVAPVFIYSAVIGAMVMAAVTGNHGSRLIILGAVLFALSDAVLAIYQFKNRFAYDKTTNWGLYASGQFALAIGATGAMI